MINGNGSSKKPQKKRVKRFALDQNSKKILYVLLALTVSVLIVYLSSITSAFRVSDLTDLSPDSPELHSLTDILKSLKPKMRVLTNLSYTVNYYLFSGGTFSYYIINVFLHILNSFLIFLISVKILTLDIFRGTNIDIEKEGGFYNVSISDSDIGVDKTAYDAASRNTAFFAAILFAVHPIALFSVTDIVNRATLLSTMFVLSSMIAFINYTYAKSEESEKRSLYRCIIFSVLAILCKETAVIVLPLFFSFDFILFDIKKSTMANRATAYLSSFLVIETILLLLPSWILGTAGRGAGFSAFSWILTQARQVFFYLSAIIFPSYDRLSIEYDVMMSSSLLEPVTTVMSLVVIAAAVVFVFLRRKKNPLSSFLIFWFIISLFVETVFPREPRDLSRVYLASYSVFFGFSYIIMNIVNRVKSKYHGKAVCDYLAFIVLPVIVIPLSFVTMGELRAFKTRVTLYEDALLTSPNKENVSFDLGEAYYEGRDYKKAEENFKRVLDKNGENAIAHLRLADSYFAQKSYKMAENHYKAAIDIDEDLIDAYIKLSELYLLVGWKELALKELKSANKVAPDNYPVAYSLSHIYFKLGDLKNSQYFLGKAIKLSPDDPDLHFRAGKMYELTDDYKNALKEYETVLDLDFAYGRKAEVEAKIKELIQKY
jgi:Tfp pilus assembly protein PilF